MTSADALQTALQHHQAGRLAQAEAIYRTMPDNPDALHLLGVIAHQVNRNDVALELIGNAIRMNPDAAMYHSNFGLACIALGRLDDAAASYRRAIALDPAAVEAHNNLGNVLKDQGNLDEAIISYRQALALNPHYADAHSNLGVAFKSQRKFADAEASYRKALELNPNSADTLNNLGTILKEQHRLDEAAACYRQALTLNPGFFNAHNNLGIVLIQQARHDEAITHFQSALSLQPDSIMAFNNLGNVFKHQCKLETAISIFQQALDIDPKSAETHNNLGVALQHRSQSSQAIAHFHTALALKPDYADAYDNLLLAMVYADGIAPEQVVEAARAFGRQVADPLLRMRPFTNTLDSQRRLRIGYVSGDFLSHAVSYSIEPLLACHDHDRFEVYAYTNQIQVREDAVTQRIKSHVDHWRPIYDLDDDEAADLIEADRIDILIDLSGHTADNRLLVFARKPAPVQVAYLGYPATTGMCAIDYRISDIHAEPPGLTDDLNVEKLWRLPELFCCYRPRPDSPDVIDHPPLRDNRIITFGCFNHFAKVSDRVLALWSRILAQVPSSRLMLEIYGLDEGPLRAEIESRCARHGIAAERLILITKHKRNQYVLYNQVDIVLDPFPCNGGTTSLDTLWMGVPFVTLAGRIFFSRLGVTFLANMGLQELIADSEDEYVRIAVGLAQDPARLTAMRSGLRDRVSRSPLMNAERFASHMEDAYHAMWQAWCTDKGGDSA